VDIGSLSISVVLHIRPYDDDHAGGVVNAVAADGPEDQVCERTVAAGSDDERELFAHVDAPLVAATGIGALVGTGVEVAPLELWGAMGRAAAVSRARKEPSSPMVDINGAGKATVVFFPPRSPSLHS